MRVRIMRLIMESVFHFLLLRCFRPCSNSTLVLLILTSADCGS